jgi:hypothetical protein
MTERGFVPHKHSSPDASLLGRDVRGRTERVRARIKASEMTYPVPCHPLRVALQHLELGNRLSDPAEHIGNLAAVERGRSRLVGRDRVPRVRSLHELVGREQHVREALGVDVVEGDLQGPVKFLVRAQIREDAPRELDAARADDRDLRHGRESGSRRAHCRPPRVALPA